MARGCAAQLAVCAQGGKVQQRERTSWAHLCRHEITTRSPCSPTSPSGLSPLARGNHVLIAIDQLIYGPIPARTGQPCARSSPSSPSSAYPRSHGATENTCITADAGLGLSPLARGNRPRPLGQGSPAGPIPARTGQPLVPVLLGSCSGAYPRSHGATVSQASHPSIPQGLSPLARGNPMPMPVAPTTLWPIPARTGQPVTRKAAAIASRAYPRSHGATAPGSGLCGAWPGLSPLARGNLEDDVYWSPAQGPIPARTGQPKAGRRGHLKSRAYPRSHGATIFPCSCPPSLAGLSPLARGNRGRGCRNPAGGRPIPARTGQPCRDCAQDTWRGAYPRSHGATCPALPRCGSWRGLSPLARGNQQFGGVIAKNRGPIPARTGQPKPLPL